jgi:proteasome lid subunit RPN8/RPN11
MPPTPADPASPNHARLRGRAIGTLYDDAFRIVVSEPVLEAVIEYSEQNPYRERGGFLLGGVRREGEATVEVHDFLPAVDAQSRASSLTFTHDTWAAMTRDVSQRFPGRSVVGWHHTHPGFGVFLSGYDLFIHQHFFREPWQIALVIDPQRQELGFFQWRGDRVSDCGFVCVCDV